MITSRSNRRLKDMRRLQRSKGDRALLEGPHLVAEALAAGLELEEVFAEPGYFEGEAGSGELRGLLAALPHPPTEVSPELLAELADADSPRGLLAVAHLPRPGVTGLPAPSARRKGHPGAPAVYLYLAGLQDPGNLGALARTAEAAGVAGLALAPGSVHPNHPRALRGSAGSLLRLPVALGVTPDQLDQHLLDTPGQGQSQPPAWIALAPRGGQDLWNADLPWGEDRRRPLVLALGAEGPGLPDNLEERAHLRLTIPLAEPVESLNATVAAALVLFEVVRRGRLPENVS